jgi:K+-sensing histidine kinase KdpD
MRNLIINTQGTNSDGLADGNGIDKVNNIHNYDMIKCPTILTGVSHEVRTHMNAIVAFSYLMNRNSSNDSEREEFSNHILSSCAQLIGLLDNFLDSAIIDLCNQKTDLRKCKISSILDEMYSEFREALRREGPEEVELVADSSEQDQTEVIIDSDRVFRVIRALFQNSLKNTASGYIKIGYEFRENTVTFYIIDSGQGYFKCKEFLHTEDLNQSLVKFNDTVSAVNITLAKKLISVLGGTVWLECNGLTGSGFYFSIPVKKTGSPDVSIDNYLNSMIAI